MEFEIKLDIDNVIKDFDKRLKRLNNALQKVEEQTALATELHLRELANQHLKSGKEKYQDGIQVEALQKGYKIYLTPTAEQFESGRGSYDMLPGLLSSFQAKFSSKTGNKYLIVPFLHGKDKSESTAKEKTMNTAIQREMTKLGMGKIDDSKLSRGLLEKKITIQPRSPKGLGKPSDSSPLLSNTVVKDSRKTPFAKSIRAVNTFRTASSSQAGQKWIHPGLQGKHLMPIAEKFAQEELQRRVQETIDKVMG